MVATGPLYMRQTKSASHKKYKYWVITSSWLLEFCSINARIVPRMCDALLFLLKHNKSAIHLHVLNAWLDSNPKKNATPEKVVAIFFVTTHPASQPLLLWLDHIDWVICADCKDDFINIYWTCLRECGERRNINKHAIRRQLHDCTFFTLYRHNTPHANICPFNCSIQQNA